MTTGQDRQALKTFQVRQARLADLVGRTRKAVDALAAPAGSDHNLSALPGLLAGIDARVGGTAFKVMVVGQFKRGKSTLINAMLGQEVLPAYYVPTTAIVNEVKYGDPPHAVLYPLDGGAPLRIGIGELGEHVVIDEVDPRRRNPYERAEVYWPLALCGDGVEIIDSPGLNEDEERERITLGRLPEADAIVFVLDVGQALDGQERRFLIDHILPLGHKDTFFVYNRINYIRKDVERTKRSARARLEQAPGDGGTLEIRPDRLHFVDAQGALDGRIAGDAAMVTGSGMVEFEQALEHFLVHGRGRGKLLGPAEALAEAIGGARSAVSMGERALHVRLGDLERDYEVKGPRLAALEGQRRQILRKLEQDVRAIELTVEGVALRFIGDLVRRCPEWAAEAEPSAKVTMFPGRVKEQAEAVIEEMSELLSGRIQAELRAFLQGPLQELLTDRVAELEQGLERDLREFVTSVDRVEADLIGTAPLTASEQERSTMERVLAGTLGAMTLGVGGAYIGGRFGARSLARVALPHIGVMVAGAALSLTPAALIIAVLGTQILSGHQLTQGINTRLRAQVGEAVSRHLESTGPDRARAIADQVGSGLRGFAARVGAGSLAEIDTLQATIEQSISVIRQGQAGVEEERARLDALRDRLDAIEAELHDFVREIDGAATGE